jgi:predicted ester cyclase
MVTASVAELGPLFFLEQDRLLGGPNADLCAPNYVAYIGSFPPMDLAGHQAFARGFYAAFPDLVHNVQEVITELNRVVVRNMLVGTHRGDFMGIAATHRPINVGATMILHVEDGRVARLYGQFDQMGLMRQLT